MKYLLMAPNEMRTSRFERFVEHFGWETPADRILLYGHLKVWYDRWAGDTETDSGLLWEATPKRMGIWAEHHTEPLKFGNSLVHARYVVAMSKVYPAALLQGRDGLVVVTPEGAPMLDLSWASWHRRAAGRERLALFLSDSGLRARAFAGMTLDPADVARAHGIDPEALPPGWIVRPPSAPRSGYDEDEGGPPVRSGSGVGPELGPGSGGLPAAAPPRAPAPAPEDRKRTERNESPEPSDRTVHNPKDHIPGRTGRRKTAGMLADLMAHKRDGWLEPFDALMRLDETAERLWTAAIAADCGYVITALSEMTETENAFRAIRNPAGWMNAKLSKHLRELQEKRRS